MDKQERLGNPSCSTTSKKSKLNDLEVSLGSEEVFEKDQSEETTEAQQEKSNDGFLNFGFSPNLIK